MTREVTPTELSILVHCKDGRVGFVHGRWQNDHDHTRGLVIQFGKYAFCVKVPESNIKQLTSLDGMFKVTNSLEDILPIM